MTTKSLLWFLFTLDRIPQPLLMNIEMRIFPLERLLGFGEAFPLPSPVSSQLVGSFVFVPHIACSKGKVTRFSLLGVISGLVRWVEIWQT